MSEEKNNEQGKTYKFLPPIPKSEPLVNELVTEGHANYKRLEERLGNKKKINMFMIAVGFSLFGAYHFADKVHGYYESNAEKAAQAQAEYFSQNGDALINSHQSTLSKMARKGDAESVMTTDQFKAKAGQIVSLINAGNDQALYDMPGVVIDGLKTEITDGQILVTPSFEILSDPENPEVKFVGEKLGHAISGLVKHQVEKGEGEERTVETVISAKTVAFRKGESRIYELSSYKEVDGETTRVVTGDVEVFGDYADIEHLQSFGYGLIEDALIDNVVYGIISSGNSIASSITDGIYPPETIRKGVGSILNFMQNNNGSILPQLQHEVISFEDFKNTGFVDAKKKNYSTTKFAKLQYNDQVKYLMFSAAKTKNKEGFERAKPVVGLITKNINGSYSYQNVDLNQDSRAKTEFVILDGYPTVTANDIRRELVEFAGLKELTINK